MKPLIQIALDNLDTEAAISDAKKVSKYVDVIEVGTILISSVGKDSIKKIANTFADKIIVADGKIADAAKVFGKMFFESGANYVTAICAAETATIKELVELTKNYPNTDVQIELTTNFSWEQVDAWKKVGVKQVVYHRSRDAQADGVKWGQSQLKIISKLCDYGFKVSVTGGIEKEDIHLFKGLPVYIFIAGRSLRDASNPLAAAQELRNEINKYW